MSAMQARKPSQQIEYDVEDDEKFYVTRSPSSARKYRQPAEHEILEYPTTQPGMFIQRRRSGFGPNASTGMASKAVAPPAAQERPMLKRRHFPLVAILLGMLAMATLVVGLSALGSWWQVHQDDMQYGRPRTFQLDAVVGHADSPSSPTHLIFINLHRHVEIIEFPGGDATHAHIYSGPVLFGDGQDLTPVTGEVRDVNGDGKPDLIVHIQDQRLILINDGTQFRWLQPGEHVNL